MVGNHEEGTGKRGRVRMRREALSLVSESSCSIHTSKEAVGERDESNQKGAGYTLGAKRNSPEDEIRARTARVRGQDGPAMKEREKGK